MPPTRASSDGSVQPPRLLKLFLLLSQSPLLATVSDQYRTAVRYSQAHTRSHLKSLFGQSLSAVLSCGVWRMVGESSSSAPPERNTQYLYNEGSWEPLARVDSIGERSPGFQLIQHNLRFQGQYPNKDKYASANLYIASAMAPQVPNQTDFTTICSGITTRCVEGDPA